MSIQRRPAKGTDENGKVKWVVRWYSPGTRKEKSRSFHTHKEAKAFNATLEERLSRNSWLPEDSGKMTVNELYSKYMASRSVKPQTEKSYQQTISNIEHSELGSMLITQVTNEDARKWFTTLVDGRPWVEGKTGLASSTARNHVIKLSAAFHFAAKQGWVPYNPILVPPKSQSGLTVKRSEIPTLEQANHIVKLAEEGGAVYHTSNGSQRGVREYTTKKNPVFADLIRVVMGTGMRASEISGLKVSGVNFEEGLVYVEHQISPDRRSLSEPKSSSSVRKIPVGNDVLAVLKRNCAGKGMDEFVFQTRTGTNFNNSIISHSFKRLSDHLGYDFTLHSLRHFYASALIARGVPVNAVQAVMGHASPTVTLEVYLHLWHDSNEVVRSAIEGITLDEDDRDSIGESS